MSALLSSADLIALTGRRRSDAQRRALARMGIPHHVRPDGRPVVARCAVEPAGAAQPAPAAPNWAALAGSQMSDLLGVLCK